MSTITTNAVQAYTRAAGLGSATGAPGATNTTQPGAADFAGLVKNALGDAVNSGTQAEVTSAQNLAGKGELVDVVTALTAAETTLDTIVAVRDRVIQAYQDISRMPI